MKIEEAEKLKQNQIVYCLKYNEYSPWDKDKFEIQKGKVDKVSNGIVCLQDEYMFEIGLENIEKGSYETMVEAERVFTTLEEAETGKARVEEIRSRCRSLYWGFQGFFEELRAYIVAVVDYYNGDDGYNPPPSDDKLRKLLLSVLDLRDELKKAENEEEEKK